MKIKDKNKIKKISLTNLKFSYNRALFYVFICILILFLGITVKVVLELIKEKPGEINQQNKCVLQTTTCCGCEMGGRQECMTEEEAKITQEKLEKECPKDLICIAVYACENVSCEYKNEKCQKVG